MKEISKRQIIQLHAEWQIEKKEKFFRVYVQKHNKQLYSEIVKNTFLLRNLPKSLQLAWKGQVVKPLGKAVLKKYMPLLAKCFLKKKKEGAFEDFINKILEECATEQELKDYLNNE